MTPLSLPKLATFHQACKDLQGSRLELTVLTAQIICTKWTKLALFFSVTLARASQNPARLSGIPLKLVNSLSFHQLSVKEEKVCKKTVEKLLAQKQLPTFLVT